MPEYMIAPVIGTIDNIVGTYIMQATGVYFKAPGQIIV